MRRMKKLTVTQMTLTTEVRGTSGHSSCPVCLLRRLSLLRGDTEQMARDGEGEDGRASCASKGFHVKSSDLAVCSSFNLLLWQNSPRESSAVEKGLFPLIFQLPSLRMEVGSHPVRSREVNTHTLTCLCVRDLISPSVQDPCLTAHRVCPHPTPVPCLLCLLTSEVLTVRDVAVSVCYQFFG